MDDSDPEQKLARSFDNALARFISSGGKDADTADNRGRLAARLVVLSSQGENDEAQLAASAVLYLRAFAGAMRLASATKDARPVNSPSQIELDPDVIKAVSEALDRCLDDLPEGAGTLTVRDHLQKALMEAASKGERDVEKLQAVALEKLRTPR